MVNGSDQPGPDDRESDLEARHRKLDDALQRHRGHEPENGTDEVRQGSAAGYGQALRLSSDFIAGVVVGAAIGWIFDRFLGTSPWGLIVFLLLGFCAGVLNVMRSAGLVAQPRGVKTDGSDRGQDKTGER